ncbi:MAG TPA: HD domain-containing phosphohydrolase [Thermoanaerobaculia bacterium]
MSVSIQQPRAASAPSGMTLVFQRVSDFMGTDHRGIRLAAGLALGAVAGLVGNWGAAGLASGAGLLLGWPGVAGAAVQLLVQYGLRGDLLAALALSFASAALGTSSYLVFRFVPKLGRGFPNLRSYLWLLASALLGGLVGSLLVALAGREPGSSLQAVWVWSWAVEALAGVLLLTPPALLAADRFLRRWLIPIPNEVPARTYRRISLAPPMIEALGDETMMVGRRLKSALSQDILFTGAAMVLGVTALAVPVSALLPVGGRWIILLYLVPILWAALEYGMRGGVLAASAGGLSFVFGLFLITAMAGDGEAVRVWMYSADLLVLSMTGAFVGRLREKEARMRDELVDANRLLRRDLLLVAQALTQAVEAKDRYTEGHLHRVSEYAVAVGARLGMRGNDLEMLHYASMLHDIGKIGVPENVLRKEGPLDAIESEIMRRHPEIGARILEKLDLLKGAAPIVLHHQERFDGRLDSTHPGYPMGLRGETIPLGARIIAVVDAFDAMTTDRPYRRALSEAAAVSELRRERGRQFDPVVVDAFLRILEERPWLRASRA